MKNKKLRKSIITIVLLAVMLVITTLALLLEMASINNNFYQTGGVKIELNNGQKIFDGTDLNLAPGEKAIKPMTIKNTSSDCVHYRIYVENVNGPLEEVLLFNIYDGDTLIKTVTLKEFTDDNALVSTEPLDIHKQKTFTIEAVLLSVAGNSYQNNYVMFDFVAKAVQVKNNPDKEF